MVESDSYQELAKIHQYEQSSRYRRVLEFLMTPQQADIVAALPMNIADIAAKLGISTETVKTEIQQLFLKGIVFSKNFETLENARFARTVVQLFEATQSILDLDVKIYSPAEKMELFRLWEDFSEREWYPDRIKQSAAQATPPYRVIPAYQSIKDIPGIEPFEDMREIVKAQDKLAVSSCSCRKRRTDLGMTCAHSHDVNCFQFNKGAEYAIARGTGRPLSYESAIALVDEIEQDGLVHNWQNDRNMTAMAVFCHCCSDCCMIWHPAQTHGADIGKDWAKSRFLAQADYNLCTGCQTCVERCMFDAIEMVKIPGIKKMKAKVNPDKCFGCGVCVLKCKPGALSMKTHRPLKHVPVASQAAP